MQKGGAVIRRIGEVSFSEPILPQHIHGKLELSSFRPSVTLDAIDALCVGQFTLSNGQRPAFRAEDVTFGTHWPLK
jgi:hypothetical protein